ncbi:MAG TPA: response regulator [Opitutaceae bacterium]|jgi:CheY-like chemotaxis protein
MKTLKAKTPKSQHAAAKAATAGKRRTPLRARLLLVEDHAPTRAALKQLLESRNFEVMGAACVADAWALAEENEFDLLLSDIGLPDGDGYLLMREMQDRHGLKGVALTGYDLEDDRKLSREAGFAAHLTKPIRAKVLEETLASLGI